jgi:hypothetical protein
VEDGVVVRVLVVGGLACRQGVQRSEDGGLNVSAPKASVMCRSTKSTSGEMVERRRPRDRGRASVRGRRVVRRRVGSHGVEGWRRCAERSSIACWVR